MKRVHTHSFRGVRYQIRVDDPIDGWCDPPKKPQKNEFPSIWLPDGLPFGNKRRAKNGLISLIHECLHASNYNTNENTVEQISKDIGRLLWRLGFRRQDGLTRNKSDL